MPLFRGNFFSFEHVRNYGYHLKKCARLWALFRENVAKLPRRAKHMQKLLGDFVAFWKHFFTLRDYGYSFQHICDITDSIYPAMCIIKGPKSE